MNNAIISQSPAVTLDDVKNQIALSLFANINTLVNPDAVVAKDIVCRWDGLLAFADDIDPDKWEVEKTVPFAMQFVKPDSVGPYQMLTTFHDIARNVQMQVESSEHLGISKKGRITDFTLTLTTAKILHIQATQTIFKRK